MLTSLLHKLTSAIVDGPDPNLVRPSNWNDEHNLGITLTNQTGTALVAGDVVAISAANDSSVILDDTQGKSRVYFIALEAVDVAASGLFAFPGMAITVKTQGIVTRGNYLRKSATTKRMEDTGSSSAAAAPTDAIAITFTGHGTDDAGTVEALLLEVQTVVPTADLSSVWPVGSVFISVVATNPATLLGFGTWVAFGTGRTLVAIDGAQTEFDTVEEVGGAKTHTLVTGEIPAHSHGVTDPGHTHSALKDVGALNGGSGVNPLTTQTTGSATTGITIQNAGGGGAHNNLQPYIVTYMWKRTA